MRQLTASEKKRWLERGVQIHGNVMLGEGVSICGPSELNGTGSSVEIHDGCDIAAHVVINVADSSDRCLGFSDEIKRAPIVLGVHTFVGSHVFIGGGWQIGHHCKVAAGTILVRHGGPQNYGMEDGVVGPYSLVYGNPAMAQPGYYLGRKRA